VGTSDETTCESPRTGTPCAPNAAVCDSELAEGLRELLAVELQGEMTIDWDHVYLLGWYGYQPGAGAEGRRSFSTAYAGESPIIRVVVTGMTPPPMWNARVPEGAEVRALPPETDLEGALRIADEMGGVVAFGWYFEEGLNPPRNR